MFLMHAPVISLKGSKDLFLYPLLKFNESPRHYGVMPFLDGGQKSSLLFQRRPRAACPSSEAGICGRLCKKKNINLKKSRTKRGDNGDKAQYDLGKYVGKVTTFEK